MNGNAQVVAVLQTDAPARPEDILRGTFPVPPGTLTPGDTTVPFSVLDWDGTAAPTQIEKVTSYSKWSDGADVVEAIARVHVPPGTPPGSPVKYEVVVNPHVKGNLQVRLDTLQLMSKPGNILLVARDVFGNRYTADLFENGRSDYGDGIANTYRDGDVALTIKRHSTLLPDDPSKVGTWGGPLEHFIGVQSYHTVWRQEEVVSLDLRIHNGHCGLDKNDPVDDPLGDIYFKDIELWVTQGWKMFQQNPDPALGQPYDKSGYTVYPLVAPRSDGKMHYMPSQAMFNRRLAMAKVGSEPIGQAMVDEEGRAFCRQGPSPTGGNLWSWWNKQTARYFPTRQRLPDLDWLGESAMRTKNAQDLKALRNIVASGQATNFPTMAPAMGWSQPWGSPYGGMTGGTEIFPYDGLRAAWPASADHYRYMQLVHRMYACRMPDNLFKADGEPTCVDDWMIQSGSGTYIPMQFFQVLKGSSDPFGFNLADQAHVNHVKAQGLEPPYESQLAGYYPIDFQHFTRFTRSAKALVWLGNDPIAKDDLLMHAELYRMSYTMAANSASGYAQGSGLLADWQSVQQTPGTGFAFGRGEGWGIDCNNAVYSFMDKAWRDNRLPWYQTISDMVAQGQSSCNGFWQSIVTPKMLNGTYRVRQAIEQGITENMLRGAVESVFRGVDPGRTAQTEYAMEQSFYAMIGPMAWSTTAQGPHSYLAVGPLSKSQGTFCGSIPSDGAANGVNFSQSYNSFAYAYELTGDNVFLQKIKSALGATNGKTLQGQIEAKYYSDLEKKVALLALAQEMGL